MGASFSKAYSLTLWCMGDPGKADHLTSRPCMFEFVDVYMLILHYYIKSTTRHYKYHQNRYRSIESWSQLGIFENWPFDPLCPWPWAKRIKNMGKKDHKPKRACLKIKWSGRIMKIIYDRYQVLLEHNVQCIGCYYIAY